MLDSAPLLESPRAAASRRPRRPNPRRLGVPRPLRSRCGSGYPTSNPPPNQGAALTESAATSFLLRAPPFKVGYRSLSRIYIANRRRLVRCRCSSARRLFCLPFHVSGVPLFKTECPLSGGALRLPRPALRAFRLSARCVKRRACGARYPRACPPIPPALWGRAPRRAMGGRSLSKQGFFSGAVGLFVTCHRAPFVAVATFSCGYRRKTAATAAEIQPQAVKTARAAQKRVKDAPPPEF